MISLSMTQVNFVLQRKMFRHDTFNDRVFNDRLLSSQSLFDRAALLEMTIRIFDKNKDRLFEIPVLF